VAQAEVAYNAARALLNDDSISLFSDAVLASKMAIAHRELQAKLRRSDCQVMRGNFIGAVAINATALTAPPGDIWEPIHLWEKVQGTSDTTYVDMTEQDPLDVVQGVQTTSLKYWQWYQEALLFLGASANAVTVRIQYWRSITIPVISTDLIGIIDGEAWLGPRIAALQAGSLGDPDTYKIATDIANVTLADVVSINKGRMIPSVRP